MNCIAIQTSFSVVNYTYSSSCYRYIHNVWFIFPLSSSLFSISLHSSILFFLSPPVLGGEYRSLVGLPGGAKSALYPKLQEALSTSGKELKLVEGSGGCDRLCGRKYGR